MPSNRRPSNSGRSSGQLSKGQPPTAFCPPWLDPRGWVLRLNADDVRRINERLIDVVMEEIENLGVYVPEDNYLDFTLQLDFTDQLKALKIEGER